MTDYARAVIVIIAPALLCGILAAAQATDGRPDSDAAPKITDIELAGRPLPAFPRFEYVRTFRDEFQRHIDEGGCPFGGESSLEGTFAPVDQHSHHPTAEVPS